MPHLVSPPRRGSIRSPKTLALWGTAACLALILVVNPFGSDGREVTRVSAAPVGARPTQFSPVTTHPDAEYALAVANATPENRLSPLFWGVDVRSDTPFTSADALYLADTNVRTLRYPGGAIGEAYNYTANVREDTGEVQVNGIANFVQECKNISCRAILQLPVEIDSPSTDAYYVQYVEHSLGFTPAVWELGNEPGLWGNFDRPWSQWGLPGGTNATPGTYAATLPAIIAAIRSVDPTTPISAIAGTGVGNEPTWALAVVRAVGPKIQYISVHAYLEGPNRTSLETFEDALATSNNLSAELSSVEAAIRSACASCSIGVLVSEMGASNMQTNAAVENGFPMAEWDAVSDSYGAAGGASNLDLYAFENGYPGSWIPTLAPHFGLAPSYFLYKDLLSFLGSDALDATLRPADPELGVFATYDGADNWSVLLTNFDTRSSAEVSLIDSGIPVHGSDEVYVWDTTEAEPEGHPAAWINSTVVPPSTIELLGVAPVSTAGPPPAPLGLFFASGNWSTSDTAVHPTWIPAPGPITNVSITYGTPTARAPYCAVTNEVSTGFATGGLTIMGLTPSTNYCFQVRNWDSSGASAPTPFVNTTTLLGPPIGVRVVGVGSTNVSISWTDPTANAPYSVANATVFAGPSCLDLDRAVSVGANATTVGVEGLDPHTRYCFVVAAWDATGMGNLSEPVNATTGAGPPGPVLAGPLLLVVVGAIAAGAVIATIALAITLPPRRPRPP
jgi:Fibronectin type III domain